MRIARIADVVIARQSEQRQIKGAQQPGAVGRIGLLVRRVDRHVAGVDDQIRLLRPQPGGDRFPVGHEVLLAGTEMRIRDLNDANHELSRLT